jgi:CheY-like chemotaxis protein/anti-sigma regulatory factor (Ser/Thr protein kinase)
LRRQIENPPEVLEKLRDCLASCAGLLDQLLDISKLDSGATATTLSVSSLASIQERLGTEVRPLADAKGLELRVVRSSASIETDPQLLEQMLRNLLVNAVRYTDTGRIVFGARRIGGGVRIEVRDTGVGIPADRIDRIFDDFYRVEEQASRRPGLGLGLGIVKRISELLGHPVSVHSTVGRGTAFFVTVPRGAPAAAHAVAASTASAPARSLVMVIDDDDAVLEAVRLTLETFGYRVVAARSQTAALSALDDPACAPEAVVTDFRLGDDANGLDTLALLRGRLGWKVPGVVLTGDTSGGRLNEVAGEHGIEVLRKPVTPGELESALDRCLGVGPR